jgi:hypothetical protein
LVREAGVQDPGQRYGARGVNPKKPPARIVFRRDFPLSVFRSGAPSRCCKVETGASLSVWIDSHVEEISS